MLLLHLSYFKLDELPEENKGFEVTEVIFASAEQTEAKTTKTATHAHPGSIQG